MKESKNTEIGGIWGLGSSLDTNPSALYSKFSIDFSFFFLILYLQILLYML